MERTQWVERKFAFEYPEGWIYNILERLRGTEARIRKMTAGISDEILLSKKHGKWSIKEHIGHLADIEDLHIGRLVEFKERKSDLRPADMTNAKTHAADHNSKSLEEVIQEFTRKRAVLLSMFEKMDSETQGFKSMHPRLKMHMRPVDVAFFAAEHDDHHLADIRELMISKK